MELALDFETNMAYILKKVCVVTKRDKKGKMTYNSGLIYFNHQHELDSFRDSITMKDPSLEVTTVSIRNAVEPKSIRSGMYCPYCQTWETKWSGQRGNRNCPTCGMSDRDFYVKQFNYKEKAK